MADPPKIVEFRPKKPKADERPKMDESHAAHINVCLETLKCDLADTGIDALFIAYVPTGDPEGALSLFSIAEHSNCHALFVVLSIALDELKDAMLHREEVNVGIDPDDGPQPSG